MDEITVNGYTLTPGVVFTVTGERGRFTFRKVNPDGSLACFGGTFGRERWRDFRPDRLSKVQKPKAARR